ncbi:MAG: hypothetical protein D6732_06435 [Methanobacteriota archaeon]|nr:MAG: hypothetical protein D6732_06435 [Euryarchaeota archaeon]
MGMTGNVSPPYIKSVKVPQTVRAGEPFTIEVNAEWPNPSWKHVDTKIKVDENNHVIVVDHLGRRGPGMALMVIQPFQFTERLVVPSSGLWKLVVRGRAGNKELDITVS